MCTFFFCRIDVHENAETNTVTTTFELPGLAKENVNIDVHNNVLTVSGESKLSAERDENGYAVRERRYGKFSRSVPLPQGTKVFALSDGVFIGF
jgi:HSP20 family protein